VLRIGWDGSLTPTPGSPVSSGGIDPVTIAANDGLVYVANAGDMSGGSNYSGFTLSSDGQLRPIPNSTVSFPIGSGPRDVVLNANNTKLAGMQVTTSVINSFIVNPDGRLHAAHGSPFTAQGLGPFGSEFRPTNPNQLFVDNAHSGTGLGTVSAYNDLPNGTLSSIGASPYADFQTAPCWQVISPNGQYLYALDTGSGEISAYSIARDGTLTLLSNTAVSTTPGVTGTDVALSPDGRYLYLNMGGVHAVGAFAVNGGSVTQLPNSPTPTPAGAVTGGITTN
jgi:6-phosphogluconolactonase